VLVNRMVRKIFRPNMEEAKEVWRKLHKEELDKFRSSSTSYLQDDKRKENKINSAYEGT
jgi:hypothetical protein